MNEIWKCYITFYDIFIASSHLQKPRSRLKKYNFFNCVLHNFFIASICFTYNCIYKFLGTLKQKS